MNEESHGSWWDSFMDFMTAHPRAQTVLTTIIVIIIMSLIVTIIAIVMQYIWPVEVNSKDADDDEG